MSASERPHCAKCQRRLWWRMVGTTSHLEPIYRWCSRRSNTTPWPEACPKGRFHSPA